MGHQFAERLKELRRIRGVKQRDLELVLNLRPGTVSQYERGLREPGFDMLVTVAEFFETSVDYLLGRPDAPQVSYALQEARRRLADRLAKADEPLTMPLAVRLATEAAPEMFGLPRLARRVGVPVAALRLWQEGLAPLPEGKLAELMHHLGIVPQRLTTHTNPARLEDGGLHRSTG